MSLYLVTDTPQHSEQEDEDVFSIPCPRCQNPIWFVLVCRTTEMEDTRLRITIHAEMTEEHFCPVPDDRPMEIAA